MPISELIRDRKIAPDQLAFPLDGQGGGMRTSTYQATLQDLRTTTVNNITVVESTQRLKAEVKARTQAERRAKHAISTHHSVAECDIVATTEINMSTTHALPFGNAVIWSPAIIQYSDGTPTGTNTMLRPSANTSGVWWVYSHLKIAFTAGMAVTEVRLLILRNGSIWRVVDAVDADYAGDNAAYILDAVLGGGCHVPLDHGDYAQVGIYAFNGAGGSQSFTYPGSIAGYMSAHRELCHTDTFTGNPSPGDNYVFS